MNKAKVAVPPSLHGSGVSRRNSSNGARRNRRNDGHRRNGTGDENIVLRAERLQLEAAIQRYADLYEFAPVGYVTFDRAGRIGQVNLAACELLHLKRDALIGSPFTLCVVPNDLTIFLNHLVRCRAGERRVESNLHLRRRIGEPVSVLLSSTPTAVFHDGAHVYQTAIVDLTERERAERALREKEAELEQVITQTPFMLTRCTRDLRYRYVSEAYAKMFARAPADFVGKKIADIIGDDALETIRPHIERVLRSGKTVSYEGVVPFPGKPRFLHAVYVPDKDAFGEVVGWIASIIDVTERKRTEADALRLAAVVQSSHDAVVAKTLDGIVTDWNKGAERIFGYKAKEIVGKSILTLIPKDRHPEEKEILRKIHHGEWIDHFQTLRRRKDGKLIEVSLTISPIKNSKGEIVGASKIARDITKQKQIERRLAEQARLLDLSNEAILVRDKDDRITYWNHGARELYGYSAEQALGKVSHKLLRTQHPEPLDRIYYKLERDGRWTGELIHKRKNGTKVVVMSHWALDRDESGERGFVLETNADITHRKAAEVKLQKSKQLLEKLVQHRTRALMSANTELQNEIKRRKGLEGQILEVTDREQEKLGQELHDGLCQQLTAIGFLARATALRLKDHRVVQTEELEKIAQLINRSVMDARNIARDLHKEEITAPEFVRALEDLVERKVWRTRCRLDLKTEINIEDDRVASELYRILREAIINANKHAEATEIVLEIRRSKNELIFAVTDNGTGFRTKPKGQGLGFHIMKYRAESIGARLELESLKKGGARVTLSLPLD
jgi:PAS domain S-box-containing protein